MSQSEHNTKQRRASLYNYASFRLKAIENVKSIWINLPLGYTSRTKLFLIERKMKQLAEQAGDIIANDYNTRWKGK